MQVLKLRAEKVNRSLVSLYRVFKAVQRIHDLEKGSACGFSAGRKPCGHNIGAHAEGLESLRGSVAAVLCSGVELLHGVGKLIHGEDAFLCTVH